MFDHPLKQYALFKDFEEKLAARQTPGVPAALDANPHAKAYYGAIRLVLGEAACDSMDETRRDELVVHATAIDAVVRDAVAEHSLTIAYQRLANELPQGLHRALRQMLDSLVAVADGRPIGMFSDLIVEVSPNRVLVGPSSDDPVVYGIQRRFTVRATQTCHRCGRKGNARQDLCGRVRCAKCAAPALLLHAIDQVLKEAGPLWETRGRSDSKELPPLLRPVFRAYVAHDARTKLNMVDEIDHDIFAGWTRLLRGLASELRHGTAVAA